MNEGLAEFESLNGLDVETDMFMRDATLANAVPPLDRLGGYVQYRVGQTMYWYIAENYGRDKVPELLHRIRSTRSPELGFRSTFGLGIGEFGEKFIDFLKKQYFPDIAKFDDPGNFAEVFADHRAIGNFFNSSPEISPDGDYVAYLSDRDDYFDIYVQSVTNPRDVRRILKRGGATSNFEELHLLTPGITWSPDGKTVAIASKAGRYDAITLIDVASTDQEQLPTLSLDGIHQLKWSPDGANLAMIAYKDGASDIYLYNFASRTLQNLTRDVYSDQDVAWTSDGKYIYFASDREDNLAPGTPVDGIAQAAYVRRSNDLYRFEVGKNTIERITATPTANEISPSITRGGTLLFISDANGINNVYTSKLEGGDARPLTNSVSKIDQISVSLDGGKLAFSAVRKGGYNLYIMRSPLDRRVEAIPTTTFRQTTTERVAVRDSMLERYKMDSTGLVKDERDTAAGYGDVGVDLQNYVYSDEPELDRSATNYRQARAAEPITNFKDSTGNYIEREYKVVFSSDVILGTAGYTGYYGLQGSTQMLFSDELGNHQLYFATNLLLDLKNSDYLLAYFSLANRVNFGLQGFHSARFLYTTPDPGYEDQFDYFLSRFRTYGLTGIASYPFDRFNRVDLNFSTLVLEKDVIDDRVDIATKRKYALVPTASFIHDNVLWSYFYPKSGTRYNASLSATPALGENIIGFVTPQFDWRLYKKITGDLTLATRLSGAASFGPNPQKFFLGGVDGWINRQFSDQTYPLTEPEDFAFFNAASPLRGFAYNERIGTKYLLGNAAVRFPFPFYVAGAPLALLGEIFTDAGAAWDEQLFLFQKKADGGWRTRDLLLSTGLGLRTYLFGFYLKMDVAWTTTLDTWSSPRYIFSLGEDF
jgi:Tol biopolymer transport system component